MMELEQRDDLQPKCPHCKEAMNRVFYRELKGVLGKRYLYFCSTCHSVLGVSHRKGFLMG